jgi:hypothetical protein
MNRNKYFILVFGIVVALSLIGITSKTSILTNNLPISSSNHKNNLSPVTPMSADKYSNNTQNKIFIQSEKSDKKSTEKTLESQVPWQELNEKWNEELKSFLITINDRDGLRMFNAYAEARIKYLKEDAKLGEKYRQIQNSKPVDNVKEDQFAIESAEVFKKATEVNKKIFGKHFIAVKKFHKEFEESIQVYSRDMPISLDFGFDD